ncbi:MAG TPA: DUF1629 domain-containing protein [Phycisphaerales bacterium]|nr:DUF1629 domain-containing protein [Phycisphaerales bacterium]
MAAWFKMTEMGEHTPGVERWCVFPDEMSTAETWAFVQGKPLPADHPPGMATSDTPECFEDMAWGDARATVISTRLRRLFERIAPGHAQFIPCTIKYGAKRKRAISEGEHWMVNWLHMVDCFDTKASRFEGRLDRNGELDFTACSDPVFNTSRIPPGIRIFRVKGRELTVLVDAGVKEAMEAAGITGPVFYGVRTVT